MRRTSFVAVRSAGGVSAMIASTMSGARNAKGNTVKTSTTSIYRTNSSRIRRRWRYSPAKANPARTLS